MTKRVVEYVPEISGNGANLQMDRCIKLVHSVLVQALDDIKAGEAAAARLSRGKYISDRMLEALREEADHARDAAEWIREESDDPFRFEWCCNLIGLDADRYRSRILLGNFRHSSDIKGRQRGTKVCG